MPSKHPSRRDAFAKVSIIGAGSVGTAIARVLFEKGYPIISVISRTERSALALAKTVKCKRASTVVDDIAIESEIILIATPDGVISEIATQLAKNKKVGFKKLFVAHTSGVHSAEALSPLRKKGALVASLHPIQTFPQRKTRVKLHGVYFGIERSSQAVARAGQIVGDLDGKSVVIPPSLKPLYHVTCVFASGYLVVVLNAIQELAGKLKLKAAWTEVFGPLMTGAMENAILTSAGDALTGPVMRRDLATISLHLQSLTKTAPQFIPLYLVAGIDAARIARERGKFSEEEFQTLVHHFRKFLSSVPSLKKKRRD